jgi:hypothetical protein
MLATPTPALITSRKQVIRNILSYNDAVPQREAMLAEVKRSFENTFRHTQAWFAILRQGQWFVAPAKYAGYQDMTPERYDAERIGLSGTLASGSIAALGYTEVHMGHPAYDAMYRLTSQVGIPHRQGTRVYVINGEELPETDRVIVEAVLALLENAGISQAAKDRLRERI